MSFTFHSREDYGRGGDPWGFFLGLKDRNPERWRVAYTRGSVGSTTEEQVKEEEDFIEWCTDRVTEAKLGRHILTRFIRPVNGVEQHKLDCQIDALGHQKRVLELEGELVVLSWHGLVTDRDVVRSAISEDLEDHCQTSNVFLDAVGGSLLQEQLERYLLPTGSRHPIDLDMLVDDGAAMAIMCGEHDADESHHFFMTIH
jgi:hypothetical protein